jgi:SAM-dependent methyltransferase
MPTNLDVARSSSTFLTSGCPLCGAREPRSVYGRELLGVVWELLHCPACGLRYTSPCPTDEQIGRFYSGDYHQELMAPGATERTFGKKFRRYVAWIRKFRRSGRALDIGCSTGLLVRLLGDSGFEAEGMEMNAASAAWAAEHQGIKVRTDLLQDGTFPAGSFDLVTMGDVLEHTVTPLSFLAIVRKILKPGGHMFVSFPDVSSLESRYWYWLSRWTGRGWLWRTCHIPGHIWEFTRVTAERTFREAGFDLVGFRRSQPLPEVNRSLSGLLALPTLLLCLPGVARLCGTQMEFIIRRR